MNNTIMKKWVKALRSGKYKQGRGTLCQVDKKGNESFCCLGVLCDLYNKDRKAKKKKGLNVERTPNEGFADGSLSKAQFITMYNDVDGTLPDIVAHWAEFNEWNFEGNFMALEGRDTTSVSRSLVDLNDGCDERKPKSFKQIADIIEKNYEQL